MDILEQLERVEAQRNAYELACKNNFENCDYAISAFREWYMAAIELFCEVLGEDDPLFQKFRKADVSGNGFDLRDVYYSLSGDYALLKVRVRKIEQQGKTPEKENKPKKIFISHASKDKKFTHALILLLNTLGFEEDDIFCSSEPGYWIKKGDFFRVIKEQFEKNDLYVIFIQSPRFYASSVSLNEMGAAWAMHSEYYSFLTKDMEYENMNTVVNNHEIACKVDKEDAKDRLNDWQKEILKYFGKEEVANWSIWEQNRDEFLRTVRRIRYKKVEQKEEPAEAKRSNVRLTEDEEKKLMEWVKTGDINMYYLYSMDGHSIMLGDMEYVIHSGREEAGWKAFFKRLLAMGLVELVGQDEDGPRYQLTEAAFKYVEK